MIDSKWVRAYPELFEGLADEQARAIDETIANHVLEGWAPQREDVELLTRSARGELSADDEIAEAVARARQRRMVHA